MLAVSGVTEMDSTSADVSTVVPVIVPKDAVIVAAPGSEGNAFAKPPLVTFATAVFEEVHVAKEVRFCTAPFRRVPVAVKPTPVPPAIVGSAGDSAMDTRGDEVMTVEEEIAPSLTVTVVEPAVEAAAKPLASTATIPGSADCHTTEDVMLFVAPFS